MTSPSTKYFFVLNYSYPKDRRKEGLQHEEDKNWKLTVDFICRFAKTNFKPL